MKLFQNSVINKYLKVQDQKEIDCFYNKYSFHFLNSKMQREIHKMKKVRIEYLIEQKQKANEIKQQIQQTDNQIGQMVYKLYGLKEEEIAVVEGS